jgi:hypothetical protein
LSALIEWYEHELREPPFRVVHEAAPSKELGEPSKFGGHVHPVMRFHVSSKQRLRVLVF